MYNYVDSQITYFRRLIIASEKLFTTFEKNRTIFILFYINGSNEYAAIEDYLSLQRYPLNSTKNIKRALRNKYSSYATKSGQLVRRSGENHPLVITADKLLDILKEVHDNCGHQCFKYSYNIAKERYYWPNMYNEFMLTS